MTLQLLPLRASTKIETIVTGTAAVATVFRASTGIETIVTDTAAIAM
jgi:hypothetical protein